jgi:hypothetical protein
MSKVYYLHTLDGQPAFFDKYQVCYSTSYGEAVKLVETLKQIKREQKKSREWRRNEGYSDNAAFYGYRRVRA